ncbi:hypothetical protein TBR22_A08590 [Luteitalea sp. TBR-22]|uniref:nucleoside hydrolase n=1 Tax=Luteitalea sp. TBR-22 TaxID=2802971 RepID=UPI001AFAAE89|nr:nucleoside hydrolase [Luteitalea sp. TBR-22]BCS31656.1 hypothetical protein TBR22_A08590 [Luteitalea sp. TBR-22]
MSARALSLALIVAGLLSPVLTAPARGQSARLPVIVDTDANNELDDQHALAYVLLNGDAFRVVGVTVNATSGGGGIASHVEEARRVMALCQVEAHVPLRAGANGSFADIRAHLAEAAYDGKAAVDFIVAAARAATEGEPLVLLPIGKLTNVALALAADPTIAGKVRIVWLGSNYPDPGEYNQDNDPEALRYVLSVNVPFEMVVVRYGKPDGTDALRVTPADVRARFAGQGPRIATPVTGRHGGTFSTIGDYSADLFAHIRLDGTPPSRALYDLGAVAIAKDGRWARARTHPAPALVGTRWEERPDNPRRITIWERPDREAIIADFARTLEHPVAGRP